MVKNAELGKELVLTVENKVGVLAAISKTLADHGINIEGVAGYGMDKEARIMLVTDDSLRTADALQKAGYKAVKQNEVLLLDLENKAGVLKNMTAKLAKEGIDIRYLYGTVCSEGCPAKMVLSTNNNEKALVLFKTR